MRRKFFSAALLLLLLGSPFAYHEYGGALYCNTTCDDCEDALNNDTYTTVYLNSSLSSPGANCINNPSGFNNKVFDCQGNSITGNYTSYGISLSAKQNNTIQNCTVGNFTYPLGFTNCVNLSLFNNTIYEAEQDCTHFTGGNNNTIINNSFHNASDENLQMENSANNTIIGNTFSGAPGIYLKYASDNNLVMDNVIATRGFTLIFGPQNNRIINNTVVNTSCTIWDGWGCDFYFYTDDVEGCNNLVENFIGYGGKQVYFINETTNLSNVDAAEIILCNADNSVLTNVTVADASNLIGVWYSDNVTITNSHSYGNTKGFDIEISENVTLANSTAYNNDRVGLQAIYSSGLLIENNSFFSNLDSNIYIAAVNDTTIRNNQIYSAEYLGICTYVSDPAYQYNITVDSNNVYGNKLAGLYGSFYNATIIGNTFSSNGYGYTDYHGSGVNYPINYSGLSIHHSVDTLLANNSIYGNNKKGLLLNNSDNTSSSNDRIYGNSEADICQESTATSEAYFTGLLLHSSSYPNITISDQLEANTAYTIKQVSSPNTNYPNSLTAVQNRLINITNITGSPTIDSLTIAWGTPEESHYNESTFDLWRYVTSWVDLNATVNTSANTLNYSSVSTQGVYGILGVYTYIEDEDGGNDVECTRDSNCGECEECDVNECILPPGACLSDSDCTGEGETCISCSCIPPECVGDGDCPIGYTCENYLCMETPPEPEPPTEPEPPSGAPGQTPGTGGNATEPEPETPGETPGPGQPPVNQSGEANVLSQGAAGEAPQEGALPSDSGFFLAIIIGAIILYFLLTRIFPGLPGGKDR